MPSKRRGNIRLPSEQPLELGIAQRQQPIKIHSESETEAQDDFSDATETQQFFEFKGRSYDDHKVRAQKLRALAWSTGLISFTFMLVIQMGHFYCAMLVLALTFISFKEIISLKRREDKDSKILFSWIDKYYFVIFCFAVTPQFLLTSKSLKQSIENDPILSGLFVEYHKLISFFMFTFGILIFVLSLEKSSLRYSFSRLTWTWLTLFVVFAPPVPFFYNIYKGLFWFIVPQLIVSINDMTSYVSNYFFGKSQLISLAPKKTWEGFIGGVVSTFFLGYIIADCLATVPYIVCPQTNITFAMFQDLNCEIPDNFKLQKHILPFKIMGYSSILIRPSTIHAMIFVAFATFVSPFVGFLVSGFKRGLRIESFGNTFSEHGGVTDRFDRHGLMGVFISRLIRKNLKFTPPFTTS
eukprot:403346957